MNEGIFIIKMETSSSSNKFDIVIPVGPNDIEVLNEQIKYTKKNVIGYRNIYIVSYDDNIQVDGCIIISESIFPFSMKTVQKYMGKRLRNGWYLQQLLKLYSGIIIPNILDRYLVIDSDTFFIKPTHFIINDKCAYNYGGEYHIPYFIHMQKLHPYLTKLTNYSGICHHMMFETKYVKEMMKMVESNHGTKTFYDIFCECVEDINGSGASEYEMYFNFMLRFHPEEIHIRYLPFKNTGNTELLTSTNEFAYISIHHYMR